ncbi:MAG TPA: DUF1272 domain-containing protein [Cellvibrionales bacterium]|mgnify:FL=1|nr:DUF1272 domain-containing protein [Cellvibrionales bacterium]
MLEIRPNCECCDKDLPPDSNVAMICSFECTFCSSCAENVLGGHCHTCNGKLVFRPTRAKELLDAAPASVKRVLKAGGCINA